MKTVKYISKSQNYIHRKVGGEDVLISVGANVARFNGYIRLNSSAALIWDALKEVKTKKELVELIMDHFGIDEVQAESDVGEYINELLENDMVMEV